MQLVSSLEAQALSCLPCLSRIIFLVFFPAYTSLLYSASGGGKNLFVPPPPFCNIEISSHFLSSERWGAYPLSPYPETQNSFQFVYASGNTEGKEGEGSDQLLRTETFLYRGWRSHFLLPPLERKRKRRIRPPPFFPPCFRHPRPSAAMGGRRRRMADGRGRGRREVDPPPSKLLFLQAGRDSPILLYR